MFWEFFCTANRIVRVCSKIFSGTFIPARRFFGGKNFGSKVFAGRTFWTQNFFGPKIPGAKVCTGLKNPDETIFPGIITDPEQAS